ncbi:hypothetical protein [Limimaricola pyoseonensis]|uniref:Uncharacterized protein n=1 Tax=Limimaricola pyoseonensis TaxID=521013 RepID=A0A1G7FZJ0_9RHOB|nr:hypothetical protein [Limimaricola pyoseonensis]SDE81185.1 hypothetical protein SAMN04488567_2642 [Limimaricola pyoseonensis]
MMIEGTGIHSETRALRGLPANYAWKPRPAGRGHDIAKLMALTAAQPSPPPPLRTGVVLIRRTAASGE